MNNESKRKAPEQQSAIAKLRKARENWTRTATTEARSTRATRQETQASSASSVSAQSKPKRKAKQAPPASKLPTEQEKASSPVPNPYAALSYKQSWDGNRAYERVSPSNLRVELAEGTGCVILGRCTIWVKHGTVAVHGATLEAGPELHRLSAPNCNALPTIEAKDGAAEIELGPGVRVHSNHIQQPALELYQPPEQLRDPANDLPFYVLGLNFQWSSSLPKQYPVLNLQDEHFAALHRRNKASGILLCGPRSSGVATLARCLLNRALTASANKTPVIFVDLDPVLPILTLPGTIGVSTVFSPILGPQWLGKKGVETSCQNFVGPVETAMQPTSWYRTCVADVMSKVEGLRKQHPMATLVVLAADSLNLAGADHVEEFLTKLGISSITIIEGNGSSSINQTLQAMTETHDIPVHIVPSINENPHTGRQHHLSLQAHLGEQQAHLGTIIDDTSLTYSGPGAQLLAVALPEGNMLVSGLERALPDLMAAVVVVEQRGVNKIRQSVHRCPTSGMPVLPTLCSLGIAAEYTQCLGLSLISRVDVEAGTVSVQTALQYTSIVAQASAGSRLLLLVQPPTREGKFALAPTGNR